MSATEATRILVGAKLTRDEWARLRKLAIDRNTTTQEVVGALIRDFVDLHDPPPVRGKKGER